MNSTLYRDMSSDIAADLLPILGAAAQATTGTDLELLAGRTYVKALARIRPSEADPSPPTTDHRPGTSQLPRCLRYSLPTS